MKKIIVYKPKKIDTLVDENEKVVATKQTDKLILINLMKMATDNSSKIGLNFIPTLFIGPQQKNIIKKFNEYYKDETINIKRRILSKLIQYLNTYDNITEEDYNEYIILSEELLNTKDTKLEKKNNEKKELCINLLKKKMTKKNAFLYAYIISKEINIMPRHLVKLTIDPSENYIDFENNKIIAKGLKKENKKIDYIDLNPEDTLNLIKILIPYKEETEYKELLKNNKALLKELKTINKKYLIEESHKPLKSEQLSKELSFQLSNL